MPESACSFAIAAYSAASVLFKLIFVHVNIDLFFFALQHLAALFFYIIYFLTDLDQH